MGDERIFIYSGFGTTKTLVYDPEQATKYATNLRWSTMWPKGYGPGSCTVPRPVAQAWAINEGQQIIIRDGNRIVYQGRLETLGEELRGDGEFITVEFTGLYVVLAQRRMRKRWADRNLNNFRPADPNGTGYENFSFQKSDTELTWRMAAGADRYSGPTDRFNVRYEQPAGRTTTQLSFDYDIDNDGEGLELEVYNVDSATAFSVANVTADTSGSYSTNFPAGQPNIFEIRVRADDADYETTDKVTVSNILVRGFDVAAITADEVIKDVLTELAAIEISNNTDQIGDPALTLEPFVSENDSYETGDSIIQRANGYSDASFNVWGLAVWDEAGATDAKAKAVNTSRSVSDYEYTLSLKDCDSYKLEPAMDEVVNQVYVRYSDKGVIKFRTYVENSALRDTVSQGLYYRRDDELDIGEAASATADNYGQRYIGYKANPLNQAHFSIKRGLKNKVGIEVQLNTVRAGPGQRVKILDTGVIYFTRQTDWDADQHLLTLYPDLPPNQLDVQLVQRTLKSSL